MAMVHEEEAECAHSLLHGLLAKLHDTAAAQTEPWRYWKAVVRRGVGCSGGWVVVAVFPMTHQSRQLRFLAELCKLGVVASQELAELHQAILQVVVEPSSAVRHERKDCAVRLLLEALVYVG